MKAIYSNLTITLFFAIAFFGCQTDHKQGSKKAEAHPTSIPGKQEDSHPTKDSSNIQLSDSLLSTNDTVAESQDTIAVDEGRQQPKPESVPKKKTVIKKRPKITFEEMTWDFGEITEGDIVEKKFKFTNTGNAPLEIFATSASCGCTRPSFPFLDIAPGESNVIGVQYNSVGKDGVQNPEVTVEANTIPRITKLKIKGVVVPKKKE